MRAVKQQREAALRQPPRRGRAGPNREQRYTNTLLRRAGVEVNTIRTRPARRPWRRERRDDRLSDRAGTRQPPAPSVLLATLLTQIRVDPFDPGFRHPTKPIGPVYDEVTARRIEAERGWQFVRHGDKWRRVVASPKPLKILEARVVSMLVERGVVVICAGGGGIPVVAREDGSLVGIEAVIDKDLASALLARQLGADMLLLLTDVDAVYLDFGTPQARRIKRAGAAALTADQFASGSIGPKVEAATSFAAATGHPAAIGRLEDAVTILSRARALRLGFVGGQISPGRRLVTYATLMVHLELGHSNAGLLQIAGDLAERFDSGVIGIAARQPMQIIYGEVYIPSDLIELDREEIAKQIKDAEAEFRSALQTRVATLEWRSMVTFGALSDYIADEARSADVVITSVTSGAVDDASRRVNLGDLVMQVGRPVLIVPAAANHLKLDRVVVGWKDTRETRRAAFDALPLLKKATHIAVVEIAAEGELAAAGARLEGVLGWLKRHGIVATSLASPSTGDDAAQLNAIAAEQRADVIVAGAYGHSRLREWALGGVTRDVLLRAEDRCSLVSH